MPYLKIHSRDWVTNYTNAEKYPLKLRVIQTEGVQVTPDENIKVSQLKRWKNNIRYKHFLNTGDGGITFKVKVMIHKEDKWSIRLFDSAGNIVLDVPKVTTILKKFYTEMTVLSIVTDFIDVPNGNYIITKNPSRVQSTDNYTQWELEFTTYRAVNTVKYANNNSAVTNAIAQAKKAKTTSSKTSTKKTTKSASAKNTQLAKCALSKLKYSKKKKVVLCVKYLQSALYKKGMYTRQIDGWYGPKTVEAVKKFQKKYKKTYNLKVTGKVDKNTLNAMCKA